MHEQAIAKGILKEAEKHGKLLKIEVEVGELAHIPAHDLLPTLTEMAPCPVEIKETKSEVECVCGYKGPAKVTEKGHDFTAFECPECGKIPRILKGEEIVLTNVEVE